MVQYDWNEETCRRYAEKMQKVVKHDHLPWAKRIVENLDGLAPGAKVMDVATGPGFLLVELARLLPTPLLYAQDQAAPMLALARERAEAEGLTVETVNGPAERIDLENGVMDVVTCKQLLHECDDVDDVLREVHRVLTPRGKAFIIDFDADGSKLAAWSIRTFIRVTQGREQAAAYEQSFRAGLPGNAVREKMLVVGFASVKYVKSGPNYLLIGRKS